jgi:cytochrome P450
MTSPPSFPLLGHAPAYLRDKLGFLTDCAARYGDVVALRIGEPTFLLTNPEDVKHVLVDHALNYGKTRRLTGAKGKELSGDGLLTSSGANHMRQRRMLQPAFPRRVVDMYLGTIQRHTGTMISSLADGQPIEISSAMESLAVHNMIATVFGEDMPAGISADDLAAAITVRRHYIEYVYGSAIPFPEKHPVPIVLRYRNAIRTIDTCIEHAIRGAAQKTVPDTWASMLSGLRYPDGSAMSRVQLRDEILTLTSTGYETVGDALCWTLYLLAQHPEVEKRVLSEMKEVIGPKLPDAEAIGALRYTRQVLDEAMRLYPPTWIFVRMSIADDTLPSGASIPANSKIYLCQYVMHRHPKYWPDPETFDPDRFEERPGGASSGRHRFAYFPFGGGQRQCIGEHFAVLEALTALAMLLPKYRFELIPGQEITLRAAITLRPKNGIRATLRRR